MGYEERSARMPPSDPQPGSLRWKPLIAAPHVAIARAIRVALSQLGIDEVQMLTEYPRPGAIAGLVAQQGANICFLDVASAEDEALPLISEAVPLVPVVAMN